MTVSRMNVYCDAHNAWHAKPGRERRWLNPFERDESSGEWIEVAVTGRRAKKNQRWSSAKFESGLSFDTRPSATVYLIGDEVDDVLTGLPAPLKPRPRSLTSRGVRALADFRCPCGAHHPFKIETLRDVFDRLAACGVSEVSLSQLAMRAAGK